MNSRMTLGVALMVLCLLGSGSKKEAYADPFDMVAGQSTSQRDDHKNHSETNIGVWLASFFSKHISAVDGDRCPSEPTCSSYSVQAFKKHGLVMGWLMTVDRLIHEGDEWTVSPVKNRNGKGKIIDPIENNDFWWYSDKSKSQNR
ncbi:MAG: membrane protein insertion efficiency factor YidD [Deltaproteobacteria bacterium]|nr:membrane protein insertion efficiency factor YidD [Deltaproteobacteria bacterium]